MTSHVADIIAWFEHRGILPSAQHFEEAFSSLRLVLPPTEKSLLIQHATASLTGLGKLEVLVEPGVTDIVVNAWNNVWRDRGGLERMEVGFSGPQEVRRLAIRLASLAHQRLDEAHPFVDADLPQGIRLHAVLSPIAVDDTSISLRIPQAHPGAVQSWLNPDSPSFQRCSEALDDIVQHHKTIVVSGVTGSGKTTFLRSLMAARHHMRYVVVEDVVELRAHHPNLVQLQARQPNAEGRGSIAMRDLVRQALRMRPDSLVIGEIRGDEALEWLLAVSSGHRGSATTVHAESAAHALTRLELLASLTSTPSEVVRRIIHTAVDYVVHCHRTPHGRFIHDIIAVRDA